MRAIFASLVLTLLLSSSLAATSYPTTSIPVIGVVLQPAESDVRELYMEQSYTYALSSYVKWAQAGAAWVMPVFIDQPLDQIYNLMESLDGIIFPGGHNQLYFSAIDGAEAESNTTAYGGKVMQLIDYAVQINEKGSYFPVWAVGAGFESLYMYAAGSSLVVGQISDQVDVTSALTITDTSGMYSTLTDDLVEYLADNDSTYYDTTDALFKDAFTSYGLDKDYTITATSQNSQGVEFIASIQHNTYPIYGVQYHIEKAVYTLSSDLAINHSSEMVEVSQYLTNFLVSESAKAGRDFDLYRLYATSFDNYKTVWPPGAPEWYYFFPQQYFGQFIDNDFVPLAGDFP